jgi:nucleotide-binding universal stress UspA family protein
MGNTCTMTPETNPAPPAVAVKHVLVPLDGSEFALRAVPTARALARRFDAELHTITVADHGEIDRIRALASATLGVPFDSPRVAVADDGDPATVIADRAGALGSCVVCLTTHGRGRLGGAFVGSVARSLLQRSTDPVVALGPMADNPGWSPRPRRWPEPLSVPRVLACVDGSSASEQVLDITMAWARALDMSVTILTVAEDALAPVRPTRTQTRYGRHADAEAYIDELVQRWHPHLPEIDGEVVRDPIGVASGVRAHLDQRPAGLVAVTTHARTGLPRVLLGATAASIVHASVAPCLVAPVRL